MLSVRSICLRRRDRIRSETLFLPLPGRPLEKLSPRYMKKRRQGLFRHMGRANSRGRGTVQPITGPSDLKQSLSGSAMFTAPGPNIKAALWQSFSGRRLGASRLKYTETAARQGTLFISPTWSRRSSFRQSRMPEARFSR